MSRPSNVGKRKDKSGYVLRKGESQKADGRYVYTYTDGYKKRRYVYARTLSELREKEKKIRDDMTFDLDYARASQMTLNQLFDRYINQKYNLKPGVKLNYINNYKNHVREGFGKKKIVDIRYTDVKVFYHELLVEKNLAVSTVQNIHNALHPAFNMAIRDQLLIRNPTEDIMTEIKNGKDFKQPVKRIALSIPQQQSFMDFLYNDPEYKGWYPIIAVLIGTGMRISECLGLRWEDVDMKERLISVNHTLEYGPLEEGGKCVKYIETPKTEAGRRTIPIFDEVFEAVLLEYQYQKCLGFCKEVVDGYSGFLFSTADNKTYLQTAVNNAIHRAIKAHNEQEIIKAQKESRNPIIVPDISAHNLRHTFCTRLCEVESNLKVIMEVMGHHDIRTTMEIYAELQKEKKQEVLSNLQGKLIIR
jgi:integrase